MSQDRRLQFLPTKGKRPAFLICPSSVPDKHSQKVWAPFFQPGSTHGSEALPQDSQAKHSGPESCPPQDAQPETIKAGEFNTPLFKNEWNI